MEEELRAARDETRQRLDEQLKAHDTDRKALTGQIAELIDNLRHMEHDRQELLHRSEHLAEQARAEGERRKFLERVLEEVLRLQDGPALVLTPSQQPWEHLPVTGLVLGDRTGKVNERACRPTGP